MKPDFFFAGGSFNVDGSQGLATEEDLEANGAQVFYMACTAQGTANTIDSGDTRPTIEVMYSRIEDLGKIFGVPDRAAMLVAQMRSDIAEVQRRIQGLPAPRILVTYAGEDNGPVPGISDRRFDFGLAGGENMLDTGQPEYVNVSREVVADFDPEVILTSSFATGPIEVEARKNEDYLRRTFPNVAAVKNNRIVAVESIDFAPGIRNVRAVREAAAAFHPEVIK